ncbi:hypothetical protein TRIUR3_02070 [Triticum urartu]|uniref:Uncharacterized protein n=1 Tax=Triticum urartu TaxID=4572 RepID=M8A3Y5_TRIUA|nr:hypothetical protein TRIUR3_02070 [Triticum urartu]
MEELQLDEQPTTCVHEVSVCYVTGYAEASDLELSELMHVSIWHAEDEDDDDEDQDGADLQAPPRGISDLYDLIVGLQAGAAAPAPGGPEDDADGTAAVTPSDEIEEQDAEIADDVDEEDDGFCMVHGITIALEFSDGEEDWIVV